LHLGGICCNEMSDSVTWDDHRPLGARACLHWATMLRVRLLLLSLFGTALAACAANPAPLLEWRVLVKVGPPGNEADAVVRRAAQASGVPARYVASVSPQWHGLSLSCSDEARCEAALQRLRADTAFFETVQRDERRRPHAASSSPNPS
jgi:hypothetical protein